MTDFHAHILPGADHGSKNVDMSLRQLAAAEAAGITRIVATPHFYPDRMTADEFPALREFACRKLLGAYDGNIEIILGAEVFLCPGLENYPYLSQISVASDTKKTILIEMPPLPWSRRHLYSLDALRELDYDIVLAHIERYPRREIKKLLDRGIKAQMNAEYISSLRGCADARRLIRSDILFAAGSDIHGDSDAYLKYSRAMKKLGADAEILQRRMSIITDKTQIINEKLTSKVIS